MSLDAMKQVAAAEDSAKQTLQEASAQASQLIADAEAQGRAAYEARLQSADEEAKRLMSDAEAQAAKDQEEILHHAENQCAVLRARAEGRLEKAAGAIVERIVG